MSKTIDLLTAARAEALFVSDLSAFSVADAAAVEAAIKQAIRAHRGIRGCAAQAAAAYGAYPEVAVTRMRWALKVVRAQYPPGHVRNSRCEGSEGGTAHAMHTVR